MVVKPMSSPRKISDAVIDIFAIPTVMSAIERIVRSVVCSFVIVFSFCVCCSGIVLVVLGVGSLGGRIFLVFVLCLGSRL